MIYNLSKLPGATTFSDHDAEKFIGKYAVSSPRRHSVVGQLLGRITRVTDARVYYERTVYGRVVRETWTPRDRVTFVVDSEGEYEALDAYDRRRIARLDEREQQEAEDFHAHICLHNATGHGLV